ncbi:NUDIX domain-containing protein [Actinoplanes solisilvae]|uniref:NUDIX domain-containing protein n=1 Tax=Actinoplanes solisilvae TaxID=2486853 RepID=UPI000FDAB8F6|nr:NUDIX domain-containing protein [Actinoplanes solisilvae]
MKRYARRTGRVIVLDGWDRVLLMRFAVVSGEGEGFAWLTPGGGVRWWERAKAAAAREVGEEVGLAVKASGLRAVAFTSGQADLGFAAGLFRDDFFVCRVAGHVVDTRRHTELEKRNFAEARWWSVDELLATEDVVYPYGLGELVGAIVKGDLPEAPVELPWHL